MNIEQLKEIFNSERFELAVQSPFITMFRGENPTIESGYFQKGDEYVYIGYERLCSLSYSLIIYIKQDDIKIVFDDCDDHSKIIEQDLHYSKTWTWTRF